MRCSRWRPAPRRAVASSATSRAPHDEQTNTWEVQIGQCSAQCQGMWISLCYELMMLQISLTPYRFLCKPDSTIY